MPSQLDLDQGGTFRGWVRQYLGPSIGWIYVPADNILPITVAGTYVINPSVSLITVNVAGAVTIILPSAINPPVGAGALPRLFAKNPITIVDIGGQAQAHPVTIQPISIAENVMGLASIPLSVNYGGYTLLPVSALSGWTSISP